jgi:predicted O-methyltransferase YrrM
VERDAARIFAARADGLPGIDLEEDEQVARRNAFARFYAELPFPSQPTAPWRYYYENPYFSYSDGVTLFCFLRALQPKRVVEIGSGYSSALMLDTNEHFLGGSTNLTFIDPDPRRLLTLVTPADRMRSRIVDTRIQDVDADIVRGLGAGDILFVDSSHVSKCGSDVNFIVLELLPLLSPGVYVHFHDVFYPFEYPKDWLQRGFAWNEAYLLRAFLQFNARFRIAYFSSYLEHADRDWYARVMPLCLRRPGQSLWLVAQ